MKKQERKAVIHLIKYELAKGTHTFSMCKCGRHGSRGGKCWECLLEELL
jgi:hypothetical protein